MLKVLLIPSTIYTEDTSNTAAAAIEDTTLNEFPRGGNEGYSIISLNLQRISVTKHSAKSFVGVGRQQRNFTRRLGTLNNAEAGNNEDDPGVRSHDSVAGKGVKQRSSGV